MRLALLTLLLFPTFSFGQHGYARSGMFPSDYHMDTYTGKLLDYNPQTHQIKIECDICAGKDEFIAVLGDPEASKSIKFHVSPRDEGKRGAAAYHRAPAPDEIVVGDLLRVYYNQRKSKQDGNKVIYNAVFEMEKLAAAAPINPQP
ncbi:MAG: single-stranded DNA-binding protein [Acidobacteriaceae bacterium]